MMQQLLDDDSSDEEDGPAYKKAKKELADTNLALQFTVDEMAAKPGRGFLRWESLGVVGKILAFILAFFSRAEGEGEKSQSFHRGSNTTSPPVGLKTD